MADLVRIVSVARKEWPWLVLGIAAAVGVIIANSLLMAVSGWFIASMAVAGITKLSFNYFAPSAAIRALAIARTAGRYLERLITHGAALRLLSSLRVWLFMKFAPLSPALLEKYSTGELSSRLRNDIDSLENLYIRVIAPLAAGGVTIVAATAFVAIWSLATAAVLMAALAISGLLLPLCAHRLSRSNGKQATICAGELRRVVTDGIAAGDELILLGAVDLQIDQVDGISAQLVGEQKGLAQKSALVAAINLFCSGAGVAAVLLLGSMSVKSGDISGPHLVMLVLFATAAFEASGAMSAGMTQYPAVMESIRRIFELADASPPVPEPVHPSEIPCDPDVICRKLSFSYGNRQVLHEFNMNLQYGGRIALTGGSGAGKSTIGEILLRFREYQGSITIGGVELRDCCSDDLRKRVVALRQNPYLFNGTIRENITLWNPDVSADDLKSVLYDAMLEEWIAGLPDGLDTRVGEGGREVSGGEARRIALARTLLQRASVYILDEPTEGLDSDTEQVLLDRLDLRLAGKSLILITHRPAPLGIVMDVIKLN